MLNIYFKLKRAVFISALVCAVLACIGAGGAKGGAEPSGQDVLMFFSGRLVDYRMPAVLAAPGEKIDIKFKSNRNGLFVEVLECDPLGEGVCAIDYDEISWRAPKISGNYWVKVKLVKSVGDSIQDEEDEWIRVACLVGFPKSMIKGGSLNGFELGAYPEAGDARDPGYYATPDYFYYLTKDLLPLYISEHIHLGDLACDVRSPVPQYFTLCYELVDKLEAIKAELKRRGLPSRYHWIGGGFVSPKSNRMRRAAHGGAARLSRHLYGEAMDFLIDESPRNGVMDDLNRDGAVNVGDAVFLRELIRSLEKAGKCVPGGIGVYAPPNNSRVQLHVDTRGHPIDWGFKGYRSGDFADSSPTRSMRPGDGD